MLKLAACGIAAVLLPSIAVAQDGFEILKRSEEAYQAIRTYQAEQTEHRVMRGTITSETVYRARLAGAPGNRSRDEAVPNGILRINDGKHVWTYNPDSNQYSRRQTGDPRPLLHVVDSKHAKTARVVREEAIELATGPVPCYVIDVDQGLPAREDVETPPVTYWIDQTRFLALKRVDRRIFKRPTGETNEWTDTISVVRVSINEALPDLLFQFTPQKGAVEVEDAFAPLESPLVGKELPHFELKDLAGNIVSPALLRGKVVVLDFWFTSSMLGDKHLVPELLYRAYKGQGLAVLRILWAWKDIPEEYTKLGYSLPTVIEGGGIVAEKLGINSSRIVIADREGRIVYAGSGAADEVIRILRKQELW